MPCVEEASVGVQNEDGLIRRKSESEPQVNEEREGAEVNEEREGAEVNEEREGAEVDEGREGVEVVESVDNTQAAEVSASEPPEATQAAQSSLFDRLKWTVVRMVMFYAVMNFFKSPPRPQSPVTDPSAVSLLNTPHHNMYQMNELFDLYVFYSESDGYPDAATHLFWRVNNVAFGCWTCGPNGNGVYDKSGTIQMTENMANNGTIYAHVFMVKAGFSPLPNEDNFDPLAVHRLIMLNKYRKEVYRQTKNLLTGETDKNEEYQRKAELNTVEIVSRWHPNLTINILDDRTVWVPSKVKPPLDQHIQFHHETQTYEPILYLNNYWNLNSEYQPINQTQSSLSLNLVISPLKFWKWQLYLSQDVQKSWYSGILGGLDEETSDQDVLKQMLLDTNPYVLGLTMVVSLFHTFFEVLAFKNDIQFWKNRSNLEGLSIRTLLFNIFCSLIVVLYVFDNQTNFAVRLSVAFGLIIELWKVPKIMNVTVDQNSPKLFGLIPRVRVQFKSSYNESATSEHDKTAFNYLSIVLFPMVACYAVYSLIYHEHKGWYSWLLSMIYGFLLTFGFIMMTPQLFINYKLKSVAHLPWRMMTYKALNTFIDDIFAFVVKTPTLYRISCFRDDIVFFIYLYQRWIYRVDPTRVNEFGTTGEHSAIVADETQSNGRPKQE